VTPPISGQSQRPDPVAPACSNFNKDRDIPTDPLWLLSQSKEETMANKFKRGQMVRFETVGRGYRVKRKGTVARTIDTARGTRVEVKSDDGVFRPHESLVRAI
jgi:hypothetical protein